MVGGLVPVNPDLEADAALDHTVGGAHPRPHVAEAILGDGLHAAEVRGADLQVQVRVVWEKDFFLLQINNIKIV